MYIPSTETTWSWMSEQWVWVWWRQVATVLYLCKDSVSLMIPLKMKLWYTCSLPPPKSLGMRLQLYHVCTVWVSNCHLSLGSLTSIPQYNYWSCKLMPESFNVGSDTFPVHPATVIIICSAFPWSVRWSHRTTCMTSYTRSTCLHAQTI